MLSYKFLIVLGLVLIGLSHQQTTDYNQCATTLKRMPNTAQECAADTTPSHNCCIINSTIGTQTITMCAPVVKTVSTLDAQSYFSQLAAGKGGKMNSFACSANFLSLSFTLMVLLFLAVIF